MNKLVIAIFFTILFAIPVHAEEDERLDALNFWAIETFEDADKACEFYAHYRDYEYILEDLSEDDWDNIEDALYFYDEYKGYHLDEPTSYHTEQIEKQSESPKHKPLQKALKITFFIFCFSFYTFLMVGLPIIWKRKK